MSAITKQPSVRVKPGRGRPTKYILGVQEEAKTYISFCKDVFNLQRRRFDVNLPSIEGFAEHLGVNRSTLYRLARKHPDYCDALDKIRQVQKIRLINGGLAGHYNVTIVKMMLIVNHGLRVPKPR